MSILGASQNGGGQRGVDESGRVHSGKCFAFFVRTSYFAPKVMAGSLYPLSPTDSIGRNGIWQYSRPFGSSGVELGTVCGIDVALPIHFHDEDQITFVIAGRRHFIIGDELVQLGRDEGARIPAGVPHRSLAETSELFCINIYTPPGECSAGDLILSLASLRRKKGHLNWADLKIVVERHRCNAELFSGRMRPASSGREPWRTVSEAARLSGMSREGFSRRFRKLHGMPPRSFQLLQKLNDARRFLRMGESIAEVAVRTGFADQSHLGRLFRRVFGVTPGRYRAG
jgi:AraC-like DNA-binding protein/mannose-6-phosphate isomerase-like protein (cupin superfamily)